MTVAVVGSRTFDDVAWLTRTLDCLRLDQGPCRADLENPPRDHLLRIVSGGAQGADTLAAAWAIANDIPLTVYRPLYAAYGRGAPLVRNKLIVMDCDCVVAFWDGKSRGTKHTIELAKALGKPVIVTWPTLTTHNRKETK